MSVLAAEPDPSWFYSSLAQSSAAVVGFVGAFLIFRIQDYMNNWANDTLNLDAVQRRWSSMKLESDHQEAKYDDAIRNRYGGPLPNRADWVDARLSRDLEEAWRSLRPIMDRQRAAAFPTELVVIAGLIGTLFVVGTLAPLLFLGAPNNIEQCLWIVIVGGMVALTGAVMLVRAKAEFDRFKEYEVYGLVSNAYDDRIEWEAMIEERAAEERRQADLDEQRRLAIEEDQRLEEEREEREREEAEQRAREQRGEERRAGRDADGQPFDDDD